MRNEHGAKNRLYEVAAGLAVIGGILLLAAPTSAANASVNLMATNQFDPAAVTVNTGDKVTFTWQGGVHDVTFADGVSSGAPVGIAGTTYSRTFTVAGTYPYFCSVHQLSGMEGTVTVQGAAATTTIAVAATTAPGVGTAATTGATTTVVSQPFTGPEDSMLPIAGIALVLGGIVVRLRLRATS